MTIPSELKIDLSTLTWGELEEIERMTNGETARAMLEGVVFPSALVALVFIVLRRDDPKVLLEEIRRLPISTNVEVTTGKEDEPEADASVDPTSVGVSENGSSPGSPPSVISSASGLPSFEG